MGFKSKEFIIERIYWERIFLNMEIRTSYQGKVRFYFKKDGDEKRIPIEAVRAEQLYVLSVNIACVHDRSFLENGRWFIFAKQEEENQEHSCGILAAEAYRTDALSRIFKYAENQMAYNISFGVISDDGENLIPYIDSYFMVENKQWKKRQYIREVRAFKAKLKRTVMSVFIILIKAYYKLLYTVTPKNGSRIMMMSETKDVLGGNLKHIDDRIKERNLDKKFKLSYSCRLSAEIPQSAADIFYIIKIITKLARQDIVFVDDYSLTLGLIEPGKKTKLIQVWHAGEGFKSVGYSRFGKEGSPFPYGSCHKKYTHVITGSEHLIKVFEEVFAIEKEAFYPVGMPRMDNFADEKIITAFKEEFYVEYPQLKYKKIILFAPTYRGAEQKTAYYDYSKIDLQRIYEFCRNQGCAFMIKIHPFVKEHIKIPQKYQDLIYDFTDYSGINELYYVTDLLITDYSSNYFEYALMKRPVVFYTYDRQVYELTRGVHRSIKESAPGKVCDSFDELMECLERKDFEAEKILKFVKDNFSKYQGNAADRVIDEILLEGEDCYE